MADSDITVDSLTLTPGFGQNFAKWTFTDPNANGLDYLKLGAVELWAATANDRADASFAKVAEAVNDTYHVTDDGVARWYWAKPRNKAGRYGEWHPVSATGGAAVAATSVIDGFSGFVELPSGIVIQWGLGVGEDADGNCTVNADRMALIRTISATPLLLPTLPNDVITVEVGTWSFNVAEFLIKRFVGGVRADSETFPFFWQAVGQKSL